MLVFVLQSHPAMGETYLLLVNNNQLGSCRWKLAVFSEPSTYRLSAATFRKIPYHAACTWERIWSMTHVQPVSFWMRSIHVKSNWVSTLHVFFTLSLRVLNATTPPCVVQSQSQRTYGVAISNSVLSNWQQCNLDIF